MSVNMSSMENFNFNNTQKIILLNLIEMIKKNELTSISIKDIAKICDISERTIFRNFESRDGLLDDLAKVMANEINSPEITQNISELSSYIQKLFYSFERDVELTLAALQKEIFERIRENQAKRRWKDVQKLISKSFPRLDKTSQQIISGNIRFLLSASTWSYYRFNLGFSKKMTIEAIRFSINTQIESCVENKVCTNNY